MNKLLVLLLALLLAMPAAAQDFTANQMIELVPFMVESLNIEGLRPRAWREQSNGIYVRARDPLDLTAILMQSREVSSDVLLGELVAEFGLTATPEVLETLESESFRWTFYQFERDQSNQHLIVDVAFAEDSETGRIYYSLMQTTELFHAQLRSELFLPVVQSLSPVQRYADPEGRFDVPIPSGWLLDDYERFAVLHDTENTILIYVSAVEGTDVPAAMQYFWLSIYPDFPFTFDPEADVYPISDPTRIGGLEMVYIINWNTGSEFDGYIKQGVARVHDGLIYMTLIESTSDAIVYHDDAIALVDNNYRITALLPEASPEATEDF
jgi:hypothetical protein